MSKRYGFIKIYRDIQDHYLWSEKPFDRGRAFIDLLLLANHSDKKMMVNGSLKTIKRGQLFTSRKKLADRWGWSTKKVDGFIKMLKTDKMVTAEGTSEGTTLTVENYSFYQSEGDTPGIYQGNSRGNTQRDSGGNSRGNTNKNEKNNKKVKNEKNNKYNITPKTGVSALILDFSDDIEIQNLLFKWVDVRKKKRLPMDDEVIKLNLNQVNIMAEKSGLTVTEYLSEIIRRSWGTFYEISDKKDKPENKKETTTNASYDLEEFEERSLYGELKYTRKNRNE